MNKKFSTLVAGLFLAGTLPVGAMIQHTTNGEVLYRTDLVKSAVSSYHCNGVNSIDETKWYNPQIQISAESGTKRSIFRQKNKTKRSKKRLHTTLIKPEQKVNEDLCSGFIVS